MKSFPYSICAFLFYSLMQTGMSTQAQTLITWKTLEDVTYEMSYDSIAGYVVMSPNYGEELQSLAGTEVEIKGYILPMDTDGSEYVLSAFPFSSCFFCGGGGKETVVELKLVGDKSYSVDDVMSFVGKLTLSKDPFGLNYILEEAKEAKGTN